MAAEFAPEEMRGPLSPPPTPESTSDSLPGLLSPEAFKNKGWKPITEYPHDPFKTTWTDPVYATIGQLDEVGRQVSDLERHFDVYLPRSLSPAEVNGFHVQPWTTPYTTWGAYTNLEGRMDIVEMDLYSVQDKVETYQSGFEAYQEEMVEQLDCRFKGLRDSLNLKIRALEDRFPRIEDRVTRGEVQEVYLNEKLVDVRTRLDKFLDMFAKDSAYQYQARDAQMTVQIAALEMQLAVLNEIMGVPTFLSLMDIPRHADADQSSMEPVRGRRRERCRRGENAPEESERKVFSDITNTFKL